MQKKTKAEAKPPRSHIVRNTDADVFLREVNDFFAKGFRPIQDMRIFAAYDRKKGQWQTLFIMPLVHYEELKVFQSIPSDENEPERMFS